MVDHEVLDSQLKTDLVSLSGGSVARISTTPGIPHRDGTGWLGIEDSNSRIRRQTMPLKFRGNF